MTTCQSLRLLLENRDQDPQFATPSVSDVFRVFDRLEGALLARTYFKFKSYEATLPCLPEIGMLNDEEISSYYNDFTEPVQTGEIDGIIPNENIITAVFDSDDEDDEDYRD